MSNNIACDLRVHSGPWKTKTRHRFKFLVRRLLLHVHRVSAVGERVRKLKFVGFKVSMYILTSIAMPSRDSWDN